MDRLLAHYQEENFDSPIKQLALERLAHMSIESIVDVGNMMIDGFIMRDPGSYDDIIDILIDEQVLPHQDEKAYKEIIGLRKLLVREYFDIDDTHLTSTIDAHLITLKQFSTHIRHYLDNELGPVSAFTNE